MRLVDLVATAERCGVDLEQLRVDVERDAAAAAAAWRLSIEELELLRALPSSFMGLRRFYERKPELARVSESLHAEEEALLRALPPITTPRSKPVVRPQLGPGSHGLTFQGSDPTRVVEVAAVGGIVDVAAEVLSSKHQRRRAKEPRTIARRARKVRGQATHPYPYSGTLEMGCSRKDVRNWIRTALTSQDLLERALGQTLFKARWPIQALAFVLWHLAVETRHPSYQGVVTGYSREMIARLSPLVNAKGEPLHKDTVSRHLAELRRALKGLIDFHQPAPEAVRDGKVPGARYILEDDSVQFEAMNVYWFRPAKNSSPVLDVSSRTPPDPQNAYYNQNNNRDLDHSSADRRGKVSAGTGPPTRSGACEAPPCELGTSLRAGDAGQGGRTTG